MLWEIGSILKHVVLPPLGFGWLLLLAWLLMRRRPRTARWLLGTSLFLLYLSATPVTGRLLTAIIEVGPAPPGAVPQAIVVLGGGRGLIIDANDQVVGSFPPASALERLLTGAQLQKHTGLPLLVTGGAVDGRQPAEAAVMRESLQRDFGVTVRWVEDRSRNTVENARFSAPLLKAAEVNTIILVTHEYHLKRARLLFEAQGFAVVPWSTHSPVPASTNVAPGRPPLGWRDFWPSANAFFDNFLGFNEIAGTVYAYAMRGPGGGP